MVCERCQGEGWLHRMVDGHKVYGRPFETSCSRVCPSCSGKGHNVHDMISKGRGPDMKAVSLYRRNPSGERNGMAKLTWETVRAIRAERSKSGASSAELAEMFNTSRQSISGIVFNHTWKEALIEPVSADHQSPTLEPKPD